MGIHVVFQNADEFNADISKWDTRRVESMDGSTFTSVPHCFCPLDGITDLFFGNYLILSFFFSLLLFAMHYFAPMVTLCSTFG